jgi:hypothetical protein
MSGKTILEFTEITTVAPGDKLVGVDVSDTTASSGGTNKHFTKANLLKEYATLTGEETLTNKTLTSPDITGGSIDGADITGGSIGSDTTVTEVLKKVYPIGAIYSSTVSTNPNTLFGFGTWVAYGEGRVLVGKAGSGTFNTAGATGGAETVTLDTTMIPPHTHRISGQDGPTPDYLGGSTADYGINPTYSSGGYAVGESIGGGLAHNNLQPYVIVYFFHRTA